MPGLANDLNISESGYVTHNGSGVFHGRTFQAGTGITLTNADGILGNTTIATTASLTDLHTARFIVASSTAGTGANFTTITSAIASAVGTGINSTIFIQPGTYTENFSLPANINLCAYIADGLTPNVTITGNITCTGAGSRSISGIRLQTNSAAFLTVSANAAIVVNLTNCYLNCSNNTGITFSSASASAVININYCFGDIGTNGISLFSHSSAGTLSFNYSYITNSGASTTASTCSAGTLTFRSSEVLFPITTSSTGVITANRTSFNCGAINQTSLTCGGGTSSIVFTELVGGTATALSVGGTLTLNNCVIQSSNTNAISGAGTLFYSGLFFSASSSKISTTTQVGGVIQGGQTQAPSVGFVGQSISSTASAVATTNATAKTIASIALTPGIWDISAIAAAVPTSGTNVAQIQQVGISTTDNTLTGTLGIEFYQNNFVGGAATLSGVVPQYRVTLTSNTTYYLVVVNFYTSTTCPTNGRISATRVG